MFNPKQNEKTVADQKPKETAGVIVHENAKTEPRKNKNGTPEKPKKREENQKY